MSYIVHVISPKTVAETPLNIELVDFIKKHIYFYYIFFYLLFARCYDLFVLLKHCYLCHRYFTLHVIFN